MGAARSPNTGIGVVMMKGDEVGNDGDSCEGGENNDIKGVVWVEVKADGFNERLSRSADN
jgi:hypothetical protein